jgi:hypothetical protein
MGRVRYESQTETTWETEVLLKAGYRFTVLDRIEVSPRTGLDLFVSGGGWFHLGLDAAWRF